MAWWLVALLAAGVLVAGWKGAPLAILAAAALVVLVLGSLAGWLARRGRR